MVGEDTYQGYFLILQLDLSEEVIPFTEEAYNSFAKEQLHP
jgi:hypothetical protein